MLIYKMPFLWGAIDDDKSIIGFMGMTKNHIDSLIIAPLFQGKGVGKQFITLQNLLLMLH